MLIDTSQVTMLASKFAAAPKKKQFLVTAAIKKGAQDIKTAIKTDVSGSSNSGIAKIPIAYELKQEGVNIEADIAPTKGGAGNLASIAFFGTSKGGGTHQFYEHGKEQLDTIAHYVHQAATGL